MSSSTRRNLGLLLAAACLVAFWGSPLVYPLKLLVVLFHESGHALAAVCTGGSVVALTVGADESGEVRSAGGSAFLTLNAGYLGSLAWGVALLWVSRGPGLARLTCASLALFLGFVAVWWTRPILSFGFAWVIVAAASFAALARFASEGVAVASLRVVGLFSVLYALGDIVDDVLLRPGAPSDAAFLAGLTGVPTLCWGLGWTALSLLTLAAMLPRLR